MGYKTFRKLRCPVCLDVGEYSPTMQTGTVTCTGGPKNPPDESTRGPWDVKLPPYHEPAVREDITDEWWEDAGIQEVPDDAGG